jgi:hypothetical protein
MKWKLLVAFACLLTILGFLMFTEQGRRYAIFIGSGTRSFTKTMGNFVGSFIKIHQSEKFDFSLLANKEALHGQIFSFFDANFKSSCQILSLKIDGKTWESGKKTEIELQGNGEISIREDGSVSLKADAKSLIFDEWKTSDVKIEAEVLPTKFSLSRGEEKLINMTFTSGNVKKKIGDIEVFVNFTSASLKIEDFSGSIEWEDQTKLAGTASKIEINGKNI